MAIYRTISLSFWTDSKVVDDFTSEDKYFYLYLLTNPHTNLCGCYEISITQMANETGYSKNSIENLLTRFATLHNVVRYSHDTKEVLVLHWHKYNWTTSDKFRVALIKEIDSVKNNAFRNYLESIAEGGEGYPIDTNCIDTSVTVTDTVTDSVPVNKKTPTRFSPPTYDEVCTYAESIGSKVNVDDFIDYYDSNGWMVGRTKMKDWKATLRRWSRGKEKPSSQLDAIMNA